MKDFYLLLPTTAKADLGFYEYGVKRATGRPEG